MSIIPPKLVSNPNPPLSKADIDMYCGGSENCSVIRPAEIQTAGLSGIKVKDGYEWQKLTRQGIVPLVMTGIKWLCAESFYKAHVAMFQDPAHRQVYLGIQSYLYRPDSPARNFFSKLFLPPEDRNFPLSPAQQERLKKSSADINQRTTKWVTGLNIFRIFSDVIAYQNCNGNCNATEKFVIASDAAVSTADFIPIATNYLAMQAFQEGAVKTAKTLASATSILRGGLGFVLILTGAARVYLELQESKENERADVSAITFGAIDAVAGISQIVRSAYILSKAKQAATVANAADVLLFSALEYSASMRWFLRGSGVLGGIVGEIYSFKTLIETMNSTTMSDDERTTNYVSATTNIIGNGFFIGSGLIIGTSLFPLSLALAVIGLIIIAGGKIFNYFYEQPASTSTSARNAS